MSLFSTVLISSCKEFALYFSTNSLTFALFGSNIFISFPEINFAVTIPFIMAPPIFPVPINPIFIISSFHKRLFLLLYF